MIVWLSILFALIVARESLAANAIDFSSEIRPIISSKCFSCHGQDEHARKAKLRLDLREEALKDRKGSRAIVPGDLLQSELVKRITTTDPDDIMPPPKTGNTLTPAQIDLLKRWIKEGAPYNEHWAFIKPTRPQRPKVSQESWPKNEIDYFILQKLEANGLKPSPPADHYTLIRRLSLDLTGLPPSPDEVETFAHATGEKAYERLVDRLLDSPAYGERWARVWLDLARYADSAGYGSDPLRLSIWPWRDWVINALNRNIPFDEFTIEQIAGDLLPEATEEQKVATAFHRNTMTNTEGGTDDEEFRVAAVKDRANVTAQVWMGLTMGCAQCHSHKFDPITQREYYQFFGFFNQTEDNDQPDERPTLPLPTPAQREKMDRLKTQIDELEKENAKMSPDFISELGAWEKTQADGIQWRAIESVSVRSLRGASLTKHSDHSISVSCAPGETDTCTIEAPMEVTNVTAFRLELLPDDGSTGTLNEVQVTARSPKIESPRARFVRVELPGAQRILSLAEVQVWSGDEDVAIHGAARQSSTQDESEARLAIDGNTDGNFKAGSITLTKLEENPWWEVDLGSEMPLEQIAVWNRTDLGLGTRLVDFKVLALDAQRKTIWEKNVGSSPNPATAWRLPEEKTIKLQNASADNSEADYPIAKAIDGNSDPKNGWRAGGEPGKAHAATFEVAEKWSAESGSRLFFTLTQKHETNQSLARFRIYATSHSLPVRELPEKIRTILATVQTDRTEKQQEDLANYFRPFAPSLAKIRDDLRKLRKDLENIKPVAVPVMKELAADKRRETKILNKGNFLDPGEKVEAGVPAAFHPLAKKDCPPDRLALARWLMDRENPLTARVTVNRLWSQLFGSGIVETEEDFGTQGTMPSHPELLDWLAIEFRDSGWDMKAMLKKIVMSATYRQSGSVTPELLEKDPRNRLCSRGPRKRLDAEMVRDQALALSGLLSRKIGGPSVYPIQPEGLWRAAFNGERTWATSKGEDRYRRGLYTFWRRTVPYPSMATFDAPSRETCTLRRLPTNTPLQAFVTMNDPVYVECSQALGRRLVREGGDKVADRVRYGLWLCLARPASDEQVLALTELYDKETEHFRKQESDAKKFAGEVTGSSVVESAAWTSVANVLLNLDGVLTER